MRCLTLSLILCATVATAQDGLRESDVKLSKDDLTAYLSGQVLGFYNDGFATYLPDGIYAYQYGADSEKIPGTYEIRADSSVCTVFVNGFSRCDFIVQSGDRHVMIIESGDRYPVKSRVAVQ